MRAPDASAVYWNPPPTPGSADEAYLLLPDRVVTGRGGRVLNGGSVLVRGDRITWVGSCGERSPSIFHRVVRLEGTTLLPGLIDAHTHLALDGGTDPMGEALRSSDDEILATMETSARRLLLSGVTTVRDMGAPRFLDTQFQEIASRDGLPVPRLLLSTRPLTRPGGHCSFMGGEVTDAEQGRAKVIENAGRGADWVKIMVTGGFTSGSGSPHRSQFDDRELDAMVGAAHLHGLPVSAHVHGTEGVRAAVRAGVDTLEHCTWFTPSGFDPDAALMNTIGASGIAVCPTINHRARASTGSLSWAVRAAHLRSMRSAGVSFAAGTDSGIPGSPHDRMAESLAAYRDLGFSALEVIETATSGTAEALRLGHLVGAVAPGLRADLVAVRGTPDHDLSHLRSVAFVMRNGRVVGSALPVPPTHRSE